MPKLITADNRIDAWIQATEYLLGLKNEMDINLLLLISNPATNGRYGKDARILFDKYFQSYKHFPMHTVAETIFPGWEYKRKGLDGVFKVYNEEVYPLVGEHKKITWGTYAHRLTKRINKSGEEFNPLGNLILKMKDELRLKKESKGAKRSCYEIGIANDEYDLPIYNSISDSSRRLGGPCLSHLSFKMFDDKVHLSATYRSHDYRFKVPGNLLGLARLQSCVAREVGLPLGTLFVHSTYAFFLDGKANLRKLITDLQKTEQDMVPA